MSMPRTRIDGFLASLPRIDVHFFVVLRNLKAFCKKGDLAGCNFLGPADISSGGRASGGAEGSISSLRLVLNFN